jgi:hypothetical protein
MHLFNMVTLFVVLTLVGVEFSVSAFMNPAASRLEPESQLKMLSHSALVLGKVMPICQPYCLGAMMFGGIANSDHDECNSTPSFRPGRFGPG